MAEPILEVYKEQSRFLRGNLVDSDIIDPLRAGGPEAARSRAAELTSCFDAAPWRRPA